MATQQDRQWPGIVVALGLIAFFTFVALSDDDDDAAERPVSRVASTPTWSAPAEPVRSTAFRAAVADGITSPTSGDVARYAGLLAGGVEACGEPEEQVLREVEAAQRMLLATGISESRAEILRQLRGTGEFGMDCLTTLAIYVSLRNS